MRLFSHTENRAAASTALFLRLALRPDSSLVCDQRATMCQQIAQAGIDHRGLDEVRAAAATARDLLPRAEPVDRAGQIAECGLRLGIGAQRAKP